VVDPDRRRSGGGRAGRAVDREAQLGRVPTPLTGIVTVAPTALLSGMGTARPVKENRAGVAAGWPTGTSCVDVVGESTPANATRTVSDNRLPTG
jgi:hypothetical protein